MHKFYKHLLYKKIHQGQPYILIKAKLFRHNEQFGSIPPERESRSPPALRPPPRPLRPQVLPRTSTWAVLHLPERLMEAGTSPEGASTGGRHWILYVSAASVRQTCLGGANSPVHTHTQGSSFFSTILLFIVPLMLGSSLYLNTKWRLKAPGRCTIL